MLWYAILMSQEPPMAAAAADAAAGVGLAAAGDTRTERVVV